jgi:hypothetical protein
MIDPNIAMGYRPPQIEPASNALARALSLQSAQNENEAQRLAFEKNARDLDKQSRLERALASGADETELMRQGFVNEAAVIGRQRRENTKLENESAVKAHELFKAKFDLGIQRLGAINDPQGAQAWLADQVKQGLMPMQAAQAEIAKLQGNPAGFQEWRDGLLRTGMTASQQMEQALRRQTEARNAANENIVIGPDGRPRINPLAVSARSQIAAAGAAQAPIPVTYVQGVGPDGRPQFFGMPTSARPGQPAPMPRPTGVTPAAPAGQGGQATEDERRSAGLAVRMEAALRRVAEVTAETPGAARPGIVERGVGWVSEDAANTIRPEARQRVDTAQLDALDAALTLATGAAYTREQLQGLAKSYFPQIGDEPKTIEDKKQRLAEVIQTARIRAGRSAGVIDQVLGGNGAAQPQSAATGAAVPRVANDAEYNALPSGAQFIGPDGQLRRKP